MWPAKVGLSGTQPVKKVSACCVSGYIGHLRKRPFRILLKLSAKKIYQRVALRRRKIQAALGLAELSAPVLLAALKPERDVHDVIAPSEDSDQCLVVLSGRDRQRMVEIIKHHYLDSVPLIIRDADEICNHVFDLLGSGKVQLGTKIDWHQDYKSGYRWPRQFYTDIVQSPSDKSADVKVPRELSRCHHFVTLGKAYWYTEDEKYSLEFLNQLTDWIASNPPRMSINWCSTMDVAIRLVNWIWAYHFFVHSSQFDKENKIAFLKSILSHAEFITENLEYYGELSDNHYASNIVALVIVGISFSEFKQAEKWKRIGLNAVFDEVLSQVTEDGIQFEGSINYHRLVLEMFASALILWKRNNIEIPESVWQRVEKMFDFVLHYLKPDGNAPQIGDTDNGRLQVMSNDDPVGHRYLLSLGAALFERSDFKAAAGSFHEEAFWLLGEDGLKKFDAIKGEAGPVGSKGFSRGGFYFMRNDQLYMAVRCAANGRRGIGNHSHNDALSFELYAYGRTFIVDPGSFVYTPDPASRNLFRSTAYHNTLVVDGEEINRIPDDLFQLMNDAAPVVNQWETTENADVLDAQHNGYERLHEPVIHRRQFYFDKAEKYWVIRDLVTGEGLHNLSWYFHFNAGIDLLVRDPFIVETMCPEGANLLLRAQDGPPMTLKLEEGWVSPSYGIKNRAQIARYSCTAELPVSITFIIYPHIGPSGSFRIPRGVAGRAENCWRALQ
jgi:hypothetical protein